MSVHPRRATTGGAAGLVMALTLLIGGCVAPTVVAPTSPPPTPTPVFASDEEALAAAEQAYADYRSMTDEIAQDGGSSADRIEPFVTEAQLARELAAFETVRAAGYRQIGRVEVEGFELQSIVVADAYQLSAYACLNYSNARFVDSSDDDVATGRIEPRLIVVVDLVADIDRYFRVAGSAPWEEVDQC